MIKNERGFSTPLALAVIISLTTVVLAYAMYVSTTERKICSYQSLVTDKKKAEKILADLSDKIQLLTKEVNDTDNSFIVENIETEFEEYNLKLKDVSSAVNELFLKKEILESEAFAIYLNRLDCEKTEYGWINPKYANEEFLEGIKKDFNDKDNLFFINTYPLYNLFKMDPDLLLAVLRYNNVKEPEEAINKLSRFNENDINKKELAKIFEISEDSSVFDFIGTKTGFWKAVFETDVYIVEAVFAAVPNNSNKEGIKEYKLVERKISHKGGESC